MCTHVHSTTTALLLTVSIPYTVSTKEKRAGKESIYVSSSEDSDSDHDDTWWVKSLDLSESCRLRLTTGDWLTDRHMRAAMGLVRKDFPENTGLNSMTRALSSRKPFTPIAQGSIQIHHSEQSKHWVTSCNLDGEVKLYNSLQSCMSEDFKQQLRLLYPATAAKDGSITINIPNIQQQKNGRDCGVFAVAYLFHLALVDNLKTCTFMKRKCENT